MKSFKSNFISFFLGISISSIAIIMLPNPALGGIFDWIYEPDIDIETDVEVSIENIDEMRSFVRDLSREYEYLLTRTTGETRKVIQDTLIQLEGFAHVLDQIAENRLDQIDRIAKENVTHLSNELRGTASHLDQIAEDRLNQIDRISKENITHLANEMRATASHLDQIAENRLDQIDEITKENIKRFGNELRDITSHLDQIAENRLNQIDGISQRNIKLASKELRDTASHLDQIAEDRLDQIDEISEARLNQIDQISKENITLIMREVEEQTKLMSIEAERLSSLVISDGRDAAIDITDNLSQEAQIVVETATRNLEKIISDTSDEVLTIIKAVEEGRIRVIDRGEKAVIHLVDRTADLILAVGSTGAGIFFLFFSSYSFAKAFLEGRLPDKYVERVMAFSFMGSTLVFSFAPFVFSIPSMRARVLIHMGLTKQFSDVILSTEARATEFKPQQEQLPNQGFNKSNCYILATEKVRSERSSDQGDETVIATGSKQNPIELDVTGKQTAGGWIEVEVSESKEGWVHESVISNYEDMQDCVDDNEDIDVDIVPDIIPPKPLTPESKPSIQSSPKPSTSVDEPSIQSSPEAAQRNELSREAAHSLIKKWLEAKKEIFAPPFNRQLGAELLTGNAYKNKLKKPVNWLENNNAHYTYDMQKIDSIRNFNLNGEQATIDVVVTEERTLCKNDKPSHGKDTAADQRLVRYTLQLTDGQWKIADYRTQKVFWKTENPNKSCSL